MPLEGVYEGKEFGDADSLRDAVEDCCGISGGGGEVVEDDASTEEESHKATDDDLKGPRRLHIICNHLFLTEVDDRKMNEIDHDADKSEGRRSSKTKATARGPREPAQAERHLLETGKEGSKREDKTKSDLI